MFLAEYRHLAPTAKTLAYNSTKYVSGIGLLSLSLPPSANLVVAACAFKVGSLSAADPLTTVAIPSANRNQRSATAAREAALVSEHATDLSHAVGRQRDELR